VLIAALAILATPQAKADITPSGRDDTARLQRLIGNNAKEASNRTITLGPGTFILSSGLWIPAGTKNLIIQGMGKDKTILWDTSAEGINKVIQVGWDIQPNSNYNIRPKSDGGAGNVKNTLVGDVNEGDKTLKIINGPADDSYTRNVSANRWYLLYDDHESVAYQGTSSIRNHAEPVFVTAVNSSTITLQKPVGRDFPIKHQPRLAHVHDYMSHNIQLRGFTIDCENKPKSYNIVPVYSTIGFKASGLKIDGFMQNAISVQDSRDYDVADCEIYTTSTGATGSGYGIVAARGSWNGKIHDIRSKLLQGHGYSIVMAHGGGSDMECWNVAAPGGKLDIHGMDSLRITYRDSEVADMHLGNNQWLAAGHGHRAENVKLTSHVWVQAGACNVVLKKVFATGVVLNSQFGNQGGNPPNGYPEDVTFIECQFKDQGKTGIIYGEESGNVYRGVVGRVKFQDCSFSNRNSQYGGILVWRDKLEGEMIFDGCTFRTDTSPFFEAMIRVRNSRGQKLGKLVVENCTFISGHKDTDYAIGLNEWANGTVVVRNNTLVTPKSSGDVLLKANLPAGAVISGNKLVKP
jgi:hypothetical protein